MPSGDFRTLHYSHRLVLIGYILYPRIAGDACSGSRIHQIRPTSTAPSGDLRVRAYANVVYGPLQQNQMPMFPDAGHSALLLSFKSAHA